MSTPNRRTAFTRSGQQTTMRRLMTRVEMLPDWLLTTVLSTVGVAQMAVLKLYVKNMSTWPQLLMGINTIPLAMGVAAGLTFITAAIAIRLGPHVLVDKQKKKAVQALAKKSEPVPLPKH